MTWDQSTATIWAFLTALGEPLASRFEFLLEADRLKSVVRGNRIADGSRRENTAEHSWHIALLAPMRANRSICSAWDRCS